MDLINGLFELFGAILIAINVRQILKDKEIKGVHWIPTGFFSLWGFWNLFYYPHLDQWLSFVAGVLLFITNTTWVSLMIYYGRKKVNSG